jgi:predicted nucleic acid-binding protein
MRIDRVVVNASPLITLFKSSQAELLPALFKTVFVPDAVWHEVVTAPHEDEATRGLSAATWVSRLEPLPLDPLVLAWDAGPGETEVLSYARANPDVRAIVDDDYARRCARSLGVRTLGTCGVLVLAKRRGVITAVEPGLRALTDAGLWLSPTLIRAVLAEADEH